jgi:hypothetical protein
MTPAHRIEVVLSEDGKLSLDRLPFRAGQTVEVIVLPAACPTPSGHALRGTVLRYDEPTAPVGEADWEALLSTKFTLSTTPPASVSAP